MPPLITAIRPSKPNPARALIVVAGKPVATLPVKRIEAMGLAAGVAWTDDLASRVAAAKRFDLALRAAMQRINCRPMSRARLRQKLIAAGHAPADVDLVLDEAEKIGAIDDNALAQNLADELLRRKHAGPALVRAKLRRRGLGDAAIDRALSDAAGAESSAGSGDGPMILAKKKLASMKNLDPRTRRRRIYAALARRGYDADTVESVVQSLLGDESDDPP